LSSARLAQVRREVQARAAGIRTLLLLPVVSVCLAIVYRNWGPRWTAVCVVLSLLAAAAWIVRAIRAYDARWLTRRMNSSVPAFEDSAELLVNGGGTHGLSLGALAPLQRVRLQKRLLDANLPDLRPAYPRRALLITWTGALLLSLFPLIAPNILQRLSALAPSQSQAAPGVSIAAKLHITPPRYTQLPVQELASLDGQVPEGSQVAFELRFGSNVTRAAIVFDGADRLDLHRDGESWKGDRVLMAPTLFRLQLEAADSELAAAAQPLHRLDVIPDRAPEIIVRSPERTLSLAAPGQKTWDLVFDANDDYGLEAAHLSIAHAQGTGENIKTTQQSLELEGKGDARHRTYRKSLDLAAMGFAEGDDVIVRLSVADNHPSHPNLTQSESLILRWPAHVEAQSVGMEGLVQKTLPAYFASERQIIIDSEALQAQRADVEAKRFASRADELGVEQKVLRLRYGEFLGEESERSAQRDEDTVAVSKSFGDAGNITSEYGHMHDRPEAATLFDPETRRILKAALNEMWQAELHLRQAAPDEALPYEYKALDYIKQIQQAERIYLARAGVQLPQVDSERRLTGERAGLSDRELLASRQTTDDLTVLTMWQSLHGLGTPDWSGLTAWARRHQATLPDALGLLASIDRLQRDRSCTSCRDDLIKMLWPLLPRPGAALQPRRVPDAQGKAYLEALAAPPAPAPAP